ncbi:hypothetical protein Dda_0619 [Drechslerella dactyloides]|uniref:Oxidized purine nucleoside triphosphate hydrolase n=1 Tax=Drechslerella dactyloides TaxID=74499 RepID=A0AAD6NP81_DREDA|nr:hypothetical protein Dda_0619 [Drechslerella dactyloides]
MATASTTDAISPSPRIKQHKQYTLVIPLDLHRDRVLLGYKLRGFGQGKFNGFGGKIEPNETVIAAAIRELHEESGLLCEEADVIQRGVLLLETVADEVSPILEIHVFTVDKWAGTETVTDEMKPAWFSLSKSLTPTAAPPTTTAADTEPDIGTGHPGIPYHRMWEESRVWLPPLLRSVSGHDSATSTCLPAVSANPSMVTAAKVAAEEGAAVSWAGKYFIHHVQFVGGTDSDVAADGEYSVWHGMGNRRLEFTDELPGEWELRRSFVRYP